MEAPDLRRLERMARLLPPQTLRFGRVETMFGPLYIAWGYRSRIWYGIWGMRGVAQTVEFKPDVDEAAVKQVLVHTAMNFAADMHVVDLFKQPGHFDA